LPRLYDPASDHIGVRARRNGAHPAFHGTLSAQRSR
jgi:hypothetical protein